MQKVTPFHIQGQEFSALNGGEKLISGGAKESMCGWLKDKYGLSWQVVPDVLFDLLRGPKAQKVMEAFMQMKKFDIAALERAAA